jgi:hypothetical protein
VDEQEREQWHAAALRFLEEEVWPYIPAEIRGKPTSKEEEVEEILGYGANGY